MAHVFATVDIGGSFQEFEFDCDIPISNLHDPLVAELASAVRSAWNARNEKWLHIHEKPNRIVNVVAVDGVSTIEFGFDISRDAFSGRVLDG